MAGDGCGGEDEEIVRGTQINRKCRTVLGYISSVMGQGGTVELLGCALDCSWWEKREEGVFLKVSLPLLLHECSF